MKHILFICFWSTFIISFSQNNKGNYKIKKDLITKGYLFISVDSISPDSFLLVKGPKIKKINLNVSRIDTNVKYVFKNLTALFQILNSELNKEKSLGYTNVEMNLDSIYLLENILTINWKINSLYKKTLASIKLNNEYGFSELNYLNQIIQRQKFDNVEEAEIYILNALGNIDYVEFKNKKYVYTDSSYQILYDIKNRKSNQVYATIGILNDAYNTQDIQLVGEVKLALKNIARKGIALDFNWEKKLIESQFLYTRFKYPLIFNTPIGAELTFNLEKFDTSFLRLNYGIEAYVNTSPFQKISVLFKRSTSSIDRFNISRLKSGSLPSYLDYNINSYGISYSYEKKEDQFFNHRGISFKTNLMIGSKEILRNPAIDSTKDQSGNSLSRLYNNINLNVTNFTYSSFFELFIPVKEKIVIHPRIVSEGTFSEEVNENEFYFIGGISRPRGIDDKFIRTNSYGVASVDLQYYIDKTFYSNIFVDYTLFNNLLSKEYEHPIGLGVGMKLMSNNSIVDFSLGYSIQENTSLSLLNSKAHIKYTNVF